MLAASSLRPKEVGDHQESSHAAGTGIKEDGKIHNGNQTGRQESRQTAQSDKRSKGVDEEAAISKKR